MSKARIVIIEVEGLDADSEFGLMRTLSELLEQRQTEVAPAKPKPIEEPRPKAAPAPIAVPAAPKPAAATPKIARDQASIEDHVVDALTADPEADLAKLAVWAYGEGDARRAMKLTLTLKRLAARGIVERVDAKTWRVLSAAEREPEVEQRDSDEDDDTESNGMPDDEDAQELDLE